MNVNEWGKSFKWTTIYIANSFLFDALLLDHLCSSHRPHLMICVRSCSFVNVCQVWTRLSNTNNELWEAIGKSVMSCSTCFAWHKTFKERRRSCELEGGLSTLVTATTEVMINTATAIQFLNYVMTEDKSWVYEQNVELKSQSPVASERKMMFEESSQKHITNQNHSHCSLTFGVLCTTLMLQRVSHNKHAASPTGLRWHNYYYTRPSLTDNGLKVVSWRRLFFSFPLIIYDIHFSTNKIEIFS